VKILLLTDRLGTGGAETHIATLALELRRKNADVCVLSAGGRTSTLLERMGIRQIRMPLLTHNPFRLLTLRRRIRRLIRTEKFDVLHAHARIPAFLIRNSENMAVPRSLQCTRGSKAPFFYGISAIGVSIPLQSARICARICKRFITFLRNVLQ